MAGGRPFQVYPPETKVSSLPPRYRHCLAYWLEHPLEGPIGIATAVGVKNPIKNGPIICRRLQRIKDALEYQALRAAKMSIHEARALAADVARDRNHKDQWNAIKGILQMEGAFAEVDLPNRKKAEKQLDEMLRALVEGGGEITATKLTVAPRLDQVRVLPDLDRYSEKVTSENHKLLRGELVEDPPSSHSHTD